MNDIPEDFSDPKFVKARNRDIRDAEDLRRLMIEAVMSMKQGRAWLASIIYGMCHVNATSFTGERARTDFLEGERNVGVQIQAEIIQACPDYYMDMLRENVNGGTRPKPEPRASRGAAHSEPAPDDDPSDSGDTEPGSD